MVEYEVICKRNTKHKQLVTFKFKDGTIRAGFVKAKAKLDLDKLAREVYGQEKSK